MHMKFGGEIKRCFGIRCKIKHLAIDEKVLDLVPHQKLMVGEPNI